VAVDENLTVTGKKNSTHTFITLSARTFLRVALPQRALNSCVDAFFVCDERLILKKESSNLT